LESDLSVAVDRVRALSTQPVRRSSWLPIGLVAAFPATLFGLVLASNVFGAWGSIRDTGLTERAARLPVCTLAFRAAWSAVALLGLTALLSDIGEHRAH
jgi:hypothetical protein